MLFTIIKKINFFFTYILIAVGTFYAIKTAPAALYKILYYFNIENNINLDLTNCQTFTFSIIKADFFYPLFLFSILSILVSVLLLKRTRSYKITFNKSNIFFVLGFLIVIIYNLNLFLYIYLLMVEDLLFDNHIIFTISFLIACFTFVLFVLLLVLIWFDNKLSFELKVLFLIILSILSTHICFRMLSFINFYGLIGQNPEVFFEAFNYILAKLKIGIFCMNENPCESLRQQMQQYCDFARDTKSIPRIPGGGGPTSLKWIVRIMNAAGTTAKIQTQHDCNDARVKYKACLEIFGLEN